MVKFFMSVSYVLKVLLQFGVSNIRSTEVFEILQFLLLQML